MPANLGALSTGEEILDRGSSAISAVGSMKFESHNASVASMPWIDMAGDVVKLREELSGAMVEAD